MTEIELYAFMGQYYQIDKIIAEFRKTKSTDLEQTLDLLLQTQPYRDLLVQRRGLYDFACKNHDKRIFEGLE